jgi:hypothetical protein
MIRSKKLPMVIAAFCLGFFCEMTALAQGGWDVWTVYLRDGSRIDAAPVWSLDEKVLKYGMSGEVGEGKTLRRPLIGSMSRNVAARESMKTDSSENVPPALPEGDVEKDLVVMGDGRQVSGAVLIQARKDRAGEIQHFSPVLVQNGVETDLKKVDHIKLAKPKRPS